MSDQLGHNSKPRAGGVSADQLRSIISRAERLEEEKAEKAADFRELLAEAKGQGFDTKAIRRILKIRKQDASEREEEESILETYMQHLGMLPLFDGEQRFPVRRKLLNSKEIVCSAFALCSLDQ